MAITHGYMGWLQIDTNYRVLCREGASLLHPRNLDIPYPISAQQGGQLNYADMPTFPVLQVPAIPMDPFGGAYSGDASTAHSGGSNNVSVDQYPWFTKTNLKTWFIDRGSGPGFDLGSPGGGMIFSDNGITMGSSVANPSGLGTWYIGQPKAAGFSLNIDKGAPIGFVMRWAAGSINSQTYVSGSPAAIANPTTGLVGSPLQAGRVVIGGSLASKGIIGITLDFDTGLSANMELDGTNNIKEQNADLPTAALTLRMNAQPGIDPPGFSILTANTATRLLGEPQYDEVGGTPIAGAGQMVIGIQRDSFLNTWLWFTITRAIPVDPDNRRQMRGRVVRSYRYNCLADASNNAPLCYPIQLSESSSAPPH